MRRQRLNVFRMRMLGAKVVGVATGSRTLKDAISEAMRDWVANVGHTHYLLGSALGAHPYPMMVRDFHKVIGQEAPLSAAADVIAVTKARLNDPGRPLAALLFLGPTGVGKTECAKAIAAYLFGDAERLLRFDLNEYGEPGAAARLVGTFGQPDGLLTSAIRRQPFAVVLFDEV